MGGSLIIFLIFVYIRKILEKVGEKNVRFVVLFKFWLIFVERELLVWVKKFIILFLFMCLYVFFYRIEFKG